MELESYTPEVLVNLLRSAPEEQMTVRMVANVTETIFNLLTECKFDTVDWIMLAFDPNVTSITGSITILRSTYNARDYLNNWRHALDRTYAAFLNKGLDPEKLLKGLDS